MTSGDFKLPCDLCGREYSAGPHLYEATKLRGYEAWVCKLCEHAGDGGWNPIWEPLVLAYLRRKGIPAPRRNPNGFLPKEF